jgi:hypothetical protein
MSMKKTNWNFIINGAARSGKDTFVNIFKELLNQKDSDYKILNISSIDCIKKIAINHLGWDGIKNEKGRKFLSDLKDITTEYNDLSFQRVLYEINAFHSVLPNNKHVNFIHCREPEEINKFKQKLENSHPILIRRDTKEKYMNHADQNVEDYDYDFIFDNNKSINDFRCNILSFIETNILK